MTTANYSLQYTSRVCPKCRANPCRSGLLFCEFCNPADFALALKKVSEEAVENA